MTADIIFNCTTNNSGGAIQNAVNFINEIIKNEGFGLKWFYFLSPEVAVQTKGILSEAQFFIADKSPAKSLKWRKIICDKANEIHPALIYTSAGPAYIDFNQVHIMGCSNPYILGATKHALLKTGGILKRTIRNVHTLYQRHQIEKAQYWIVQTEQSKIQLKRVLSKKSAEVFVVHNAISSYFFELHQENNLNKSYCLKNNSARQLKILIPSAWYAHKDLESVPVIVKKLVYEYQFKVKVTFTVDSSSWYDINQISEELGVASYMCNYGPFSRDEAVELYKNHDVILQPSLLEVFSTSYIEAMAANKPLVVPDLPFSKDICGDFAYYYTCGDFESYASSIIAAAQGDDFCSKSLAGLHLLEKYGTQNKRTEKIINIIKFLLKNANEVI